MKARVATAAEGAGWVLVGWRSVRSAPGLWLGVGLAYIFAVVLVMTAQVFGLAMLIASPAFTLLLLTFSRACARGKPIDGTVISSSFGRRGRGQLALGLAYALCALVILGLTLLFFGDRPSGQEAAQSAAQRLAVMSLLYLPVMAMFWFSPALVAWEGLPVAKAVFFSLMAFFMNWRAFAAYGIAAFALMAGTSFVALFVTRIAVPGLATQWLLAPLTLLIVPILFASYYGSYRDVFEERPSAPAAPSVEV